MFSTFKKKRISEAIYRATKAALTGGFFHVTEVEQFNINEEASEWLYTEALAHLVYSLSCVVTGTVAKKYSWVTPEFGLQSMIKAITEHEVEHNQQPGSLSQIFFEIKI